MTDLAKKRYILQIDPFLTKGDKGDTGDPGDAGAGGALPINTSDVIHDGVESNGSNLRDIIDYILYNPLEITSFNTTISNNTVELGAILTSITFNWQYNKTITTQSITGPTLTPPILAPGDTQAIVVSSGMSSTSVVRLTANDGSPLASGDTINDLTIKFYAPIYYGQAAHPGTITDNWLWTNLTPSLQNTLATTFTVTDVANEYAWFACPASYGIPAFTVNGLSTDFVQEFGSGSPYAHKTYSSANGGLNTTIDYVIYRSEETEQYQDIIVS